MYGSVFVSILHCLVGLYECTVSALRVFYFLFLILVSFLSSNRGIVQFTYGDDGLDPAGMEAKDLPVDMVRVLAQAKTTHPCPAEPPTERR